jgi:hypothetical protein
MVLTGYLALSPERSAHLPPSPRGLKVLSDPVEPNEPPQDLTPAPRRQDHTTSPSASAPSSCVPEFAHGEQSALRFARTPNAAASTASHPASVTIAIRPSVERDGAVYRSDLGLLKIRIFFAMGLDSRDHTKSSPSGAYFFARRHQPAGWVERSAIPIN